MILIDVVLINAAIFGALIIRFDGIAQIPARYVNAFFDVNIVFTAILIACFYFYGLYDRVWRYASIGELISIFHAVTIGVLTSTGVTYFIIGSGELILPRSIFFLSWMIIISLTGGSRLVWRLIVHEQLSFSFKDNTGRPILIVGAGGTGVLVAKELKRHYKDTVNIVGFIDDDPEKQRLKVLGIPVLGSREKIPEMVNRYEVEEIIIAIPSAQGKIIQQIVDSCQQADVKIKILPGVYDLIEENITVSHIREVEVEDLLGRAPVQVDLEEICQYLKNQTVLVTGAGGSIGSELCRQIAQFSPRKLLLLDNCENSIFDIEMEFGDLSISSEIVPLVKDIRDKQAIDLIFEEHMPYVVFHAAAHKHVPLMEANPEEAIKNNILGTYNTAQAADRIGVKKFVFISTDKAVNPVSIMGASKRVAEMFIQYMDKKSSTNFVAVRFGNVLDSRCSVVPLFKKQIARGGPVTVTHQEMTRYFMTIPEAVQLIIQAGAIAKGGEVFVLDMGEPVKIMNLAKSLIKLSGFEPGKDIDITITGIRPGEKLFEELLTDEEGTNSTKHERIFVAKANHIDDTLIEKTIPDLYDGRAPKTFEETVTFLRQFLPEFKKNN